MPKPFYASMTWEEVNEAVADRRVVVVPVAAIEQHGPHLPIDTDNLAVTGLADEAASRAPDILVSAPPIHYGFNEHNMDFPGTISIQAETLLNYAFDVGQSLAAQGFARIVWLNGHGSNGPVYDLVARKVTNRTPALSAAVNWWELAWPAVQQACEGLPESVDHACEMETSIYLYLAEELVKRDRILDEVASWRGGPAWLYPSMGGRSPIRFMNWWSRMSASGVNGRPSLATAEKGRRMFDYGVDALITFAREFRDMPLAPRVDRKRGSAEDG